MSTFIRTCAVRLALAAIFTLGSAASAAASAILLSNVQVQVDLDLLIASVSADMQAQGDDGQDVFLDALSVSVFQDGEDLSDTIVDDLPFFTNTPPVMLDGETLANVVLFNLFGLVPGASYAGSFYLIEGLNPLQVPPQVFAFSVPQAPASVPEPATLLLTATGLAAAGVLRRRRTSRH